MSSPTSKAGEASSSADLIVEADVGPESSEFRPQQSKSLNEVVESIASGSFQKVPVEGWLIARRKVEIFKPVPWFLWRLSLSVFSKPIGAEEINEGMLLGLRRLLFAAASDPILGIGGKVNSVKKALAILTPDVVAAVAIVHSVCRRVRSFDHESIWRPVLDEALVQAQIGFQMGSHASLLGRGRGLLAGFSGPIGMAILVAGGDQIQANETIEKMSTGISNAEIGREVYGCEPLQISAMLLAAAGCGPDAASGVAISQARLSDLISTHESRTIWACGSNVVDYLRRGKMKLVPPEILSALGIPEEAKQDLSKHAIKIARSGHSWQWIE